MADGKKRVVRRVKAGVAEPIRSKVDTSEPTQSPVQYDRQVSPKMAAKLAQRAAKHPNKKPFVLWRPLFAAGRYVRDSWHELRQVEWPNRRATWSLTWAVLAFTVFFAVIVTLLDWLFQFIVKSVILR